MISQDEYQQKIEELRKKDKLARVTIDANHQKELILIAKQIGELKYSGQLAAIEGNLELAQTIGVKINMLHESRDVVNEKYQALIHDHKAAIREERAQLAKELSEWCAERRKQGIVSRNQFNEAIHIICAFLAQKEQQGIKVNWANGKYIDIQILDRTSDAEEGDAL